MGKTEIIYEKIRSKYRTNIKLDKKAKTDEQFIIELSIQNPDITLIGEYKGSNNKTLFECSAHHRFYSYPSYILKAIMNGCKECRKINGGYRPKKTHQEYLKELEIIHSALIPKEEYKGASTKILHLCKIHNIDTMTTPSNALKGIGCKLCRKEKISSKLSKTETEYLKQLKEANPNIILLGKYTGVDDNTEFKCNICGYQWIGRPMSYINPKAFGCQQCAWNLLSREKNMGIQEYTNRIKQIYDDKIKVIDDFYINNSTPLKHKCYNCEHEWMAVPANILKGHGCPNCAEHSKLEEYVKEILQKLLVEYNTQTKFVKLVGIGGRKLSYDFYLPSYNLLIECQGKQHEQSIEYFGGEEKFKIQLEHDRRKREYAKQNNIDLLEIWYYEIDNIESILLQKINELNENNLKSKSVETAGCA